jgi:tetratricopeptide (TPR) repeat protein
VDAYSAALAEYTQEGVPLQWARVQTDLGNALATLGEREVGTARLEQAVDAYRAALTEGRQDRVPLDWAMTLGNEGAALLTLAGRTGDPAQARQALEQLTTAEATLREGGNIPWADHFARQLPAAQALVDRLSGGQP